MKDCCDASKSFEWKKQVAGDVARDVYREIRMVMLTEEMNFVNLRQNHTETGFEVSNIGW